MNILDRSAIRSCTSCQMCSAVCSSEAISIQLNEEGFYRPYVDSDRCTDCGLCTIVCSKFDDKIQITSAGALDVIKLYAASAKSDEVVNNTSSGGIADLLAWQLFADGYKVMGVVYNKEQNNAVHQVAERESDLNLFRGSKYIQPFSADAFRKLVKNCRNDKFAVFGLPCQIYAISKYLTHIKKRDNCILIDLYCHGCSSMKIWEKVSDDIKRKTGVTSFDNVLWRSKLRGWGTFVLEVKKDGKRIYNSSPMHNEFFDLFFCNQVLNESCNTCKLRGTLEYIDIRLGDFWGPDYRRTLRGISGVSVVTERGQELFSKINHLLDAHEKPVNSFFQYQSWNHEYKINSDLRTRLLGKLNEENASAKDVVNVLPSHHSASYKLKTCIKQIIFYLPKNLSKV